jgi:hypothetical protein
MVSQDILTEARAVHGSYPPVVLRVHTAGRNEAIDCVKGFLLGLMVLFHAITYLACERSGFLTYIKFASSGFIFVSGYLVTTVYSARWNENPLRVATRLFIRGLRLIAWFTVGNVAIGAAAIRKSASAQYGLGSGDHAVFYILLPIGCLLMI